MTAEPLLPHDVDHNHAMALSDLPTDVVYAGREICGELRMAELREVLLTNGIGGYSSMTIAGSLTRSYHGLLIAALRPPLDRTLLLAKLNETVSYLGKVYHLSTDRRRRNSVSSPITTSKSTGSTGLKSISTSQFSSSNESISSPPIWTKDSMELASTKHHLRNDEVIAPHGFELLQSCHLEGTVPVFTYSFGDAILEKRLWMKHGQNTVYVTYYLRRATKAIGLRLHALVNYRNHHARTSVSRPQFNYCANVGSEGTSVSVLFNTRDHDATTLRMMVNSGRAELTNEWATGFVLCEERLRGLPEYDDNLHAATFVIEVPPGGSITFVATAEPETKHISIDGDAELAMQHSYEKSLLQKFQYAREASLRQRMEMDGRRNSTQSLVLSPNNSPSLDCKYTAPQSRIEQTIKQVVLAADQFIISRGGGRSVVAGFHWFTDWARDTMISLPGLTIATGRYDVAKSILQTFSKYVSKGMLPNRFPDDGSAPTEDDYNTADGTLWYFEAIRSYYVATGDLELLVDLYPVLQMIISHHCKGTRFGIIQDSDGLLRAGAEGVALTWMDAKTDVVYTQRDGKAVELVALWFNALHCMAFFTTELEYEEEADTFTCMADKTEQSFQEKFWNYEVGYCYDVIDSGPERDEKDASLRPNQLIAASLNWSPLTEEQRFLVVEACSSKLVTSNAIRTLPPDDPDYHGMYLGDVYARDMAYHQGLGWTWLLGPFVLAHLRVYGQRELSREFLMPLLRSHLNDGGLGQVSELFDGDSPNRARGCIAQAWSVAELLRAWIATEPNDIAVAFENRRESLSNREFDPWDTSTNQSFMSM